MSQLTKLFYDAAASVSFTLAFLAALQSQVLIAGLYLTITGVMVVMRGLSDVQR